MIITIISSKGGVGKTTLLANIGGFLADKGKKVLMVDADIQPGLSSYYNLKYQAPNGLKHLIHEVDTKDVISQIDIDGINNLDLIYSDDPRGELHSFILHASDGRMRLRYTLADLKKEKGYDYILIDTQGAVGPLQETAIFAADILLAPIPPDVISSREFTRGTIRVVTEVRQQAKRMGIHIGKLYGVLSKVTRTLDAQKVSKSLRGDQLKSVVHILNTEIPDKIAFKSATTHRVPVHVYDPIRKADYPCAREIITHVVAELMVLNEKNQHEQ